MRLNRICVAVCLVLPFVGIHPPAAGAQVPPRVPAHIEPLLKCGDIGSPFCTEVGENTNYEGEYIGHDEPALAFFSSVPGSGNSGLYRLTLPKDPPTLPRQDGTGGTYNFQLHSTFWFGMVLCDTESSPLSNHTCVPNSDANIFDNPDPAAADFLGNHPGAGYMEVQFYPPAWASSPCFDPTHWCAALTITSNSVESATGTQNNVDCLNRASSGPFNYAVVTKNGVPIAPGNPLGANFGTYVFDLNNVLKLNSGDELEVDIHDSAKGVEVRIKDLTTGQSGSMAAGAVNGFGQVVFDPDATVCQVRPYDFHPMFATSTEHTRASWTAHAFNVAFADEIGHFELCNAVDAAGNCTSPGVQDAADGLDFDDFFCFAPPSPLLPPSLVQIGGCTVGDLDFDGPSYQPVWPGAVAGNDRRLHPTPVRFSSPLFTPTVSAPRRGDRPTLRNYDRVAFEADMPNFERGFTACNIRTGAGCLNPPDGAAFYPIFSTAHGDEGCVWQFGGAHIPGTINTFGGNSTAQYGALLPVSYVRPIGIVTVFPDFRQTLASNPCLAPIDE